jgi:hypothetical protein
MIRRIAPALLLPLVVLGAGCLSLPKHSVDQPTRAIYRLDAPRPEKASPGAAREGALLVRPFAAAPALRTTALLTLTSGSTLSADPFRRFIADPAALVTESTIAWLTDAQLYTATLSEGSMLRPSHILEGTLQQLELTPTGAVCTLDWRLLENGREEGVKLLRSGRVSATGAAGKEPIDALNAALAAALQQLEGELGSD